MKLKTILILLAVFIVTIIIYINQQPKISYYKFKSVYVTREDFDNHSIFYYGKCKNLERNKNLINSFSVQNLYREGIDLYLIFDPSKQYISIISNGLGLIAIEDSLRFKEDRIKNTIYFEYIDSLFKDKDIGIVRVSDSKELEMKWKKYRNGRVIYSEE